MIRPLLCALLSSACALAAAWLGFHHPLSPPAMLLACALMALLAGLKFEHWPLWLMPCLPLASLMPWTGWIVVEEWDLLVLAAAAGGYARLAVPLRPDAVAASSSKPRFPLAAWVFLLSFGALTVVAAVAGVADAGGLQWGWWQGYREPLNSVRQLKSVAQVILLMPLWLALQPRDPSGGRVMLLALVATAVTAAVPVWWERLAFTGLTNFSTDYRATGLFWEMHVGGAALDASLALTAPFVMVALAHARGVRAWTLAAMAASVVLYAALVTFSRIVYVAVPVGLVVCWWLSRRQGTTPHALKPTIAAAIVVAAAAAAAMWVLPVAGYRGMLALLLGLSMTLLCCADLSRLPRRQLGLWAVGGFLVVPLTAVLALQVPRGAYLAAAMYPLGCVSFLLAGRLTRNAHFTALAGACLVGSIAAVAAVGWHWGGLAALERAAVLALGLLAVVFLSIPGGQRLWPHSLRWQAQTSLAVAGAMVVVGVFGGGQYMGDRLATASQDVVDRQAHWRSLLQLLRSAEQSALGYGLGRTPATLALSGDKNMQTGDYRAFDGPDGTIVMLTSGSHPQGWGELFRLSQRIAPIEPGTLKLTAKIRPWTPLSVHVEVCEKHLLYNRNCRAAVKAVRGPLGEWQPLEVSLPGDALGGTPWFAPALVAFSMAIDAQGGRIELDDLSLVDQQGRELLDNGSFQQGLRHWFFSSDRHHMPWHAKNLWVHLWFEQGWLSVVVLAAGLLLAWGASVWGRAATHPLAPASSAALVGLVVVGAVDSVFDMPRMTFLTLWLLALALSLSGNRRPDGWRARP